MLASPNVLCVRRAGGRTDRQTDGRTDRTYSQRHSWSKSSLLLECIQNIDPGYISY